MDNKFIIIYLLYIQYIITRILLLVYMYMYMIMMYINLFIQIGVDTCILLVNYYYYNTNYLIRCIQL